MKTDRPALSIVIPTHFRATCVERLLLSLQPPPDVTIEILIVSNLQDSRLRAIVRSQLGPRFDMRLMTVGEVGVNRARNVGLRAARAPLVLFLYDDCTIDDSDFLSQVVEAHRREPQLTAVGGPYRDPCTITAAGRVYNALANHWSSRSGSLLGGNVSYKVDHLRALKLEFADEIIWGGAETELHERMMQAGLQLKFEPQLAVTHHCQISVGDLARKAFLQGYRHRERLARGAKHSRQSIEVPAELCNNPQRRLYARHFWLGEQCFEKGGAPSPRGMSWLLNWPVVCFLSWCERCWPGSADRLSSCPGQIFWTIYPVLNNLRRSLRALGRSSIKTRKTAPGEMAISLGA